MGEVVRSRSAICLLSLPDSVPATWDEASTYANDLRSKERNDWRLPDLVELDLLGKNRWAIFRSVFQLASGVCWSSKSIDWAARRYNVARRLGDGETFFLRPDERAHACLVRSIPLTTPVRGL